jgi:phosphoglycolate phosphatase-like HAD superfamily hydrolase
MTKAVIFDADGTLIDTVDLHAACWIDALKRFGADVPFGDMRVQVSKGGGPILQEQLHLNTPARHAEEVQASRSDMFQCIRADGCKAVLASSGIADLIDAATSAGDAERSKLFPDIVQTALAKLAPLAPADAAVMGDTSYDAEAARTAGLASVGILCGGFPEEALRATGCIAVYQGPTGLLARYDASPLAGGRP